MKALLDNRVLNYMSMFYSAERMNSGELGTFSPRGNPTVSFANSNIDWREQLRSQYNLEPKKAVKPKRPRQVLSQPFNPLRAQQIRLNKEISNIAYDQRLSKMEKLKKWDQLLADQSNLLNAIHVANLLHKIAKSNISIRDDNRICLVSIFTKLNLAIPHIKEFGGQAIGNALYGLQGLDSSVVTKEFISALAKKISESKAELDIEEQATVKRILKRLALKLDIRKIQRGLNIEIEESNHGRKIDLITLSDDFKNAREQILEIFPGRPVSMMEFLTFGFNRRFNKSASEFILMANKEYPKLRTLDELGDLIWA